MRFVVAVIAGTIVAGGVVAVGEGLSGLLHPPPAGMDFNDPDKLRAFIATLPASAFVFVLAAWTVGSFAGSLVAGLLTRGRSAVAPAVVGGLMIAAVLFNLATIPHPVWMAVAAIVLVPAALFAGGTAGRRLSMNTVTRATA
ncbi:MAG: hypothetical protein ACRC1K_20360 [Planctomycetia bacterium]